MGNTCKNKSLHEELKQTLYSFGADDAIILDKFDDAVVGVTTDNVVAYNYWEMINVLCKKNKMTVYEAAEWIDLNVIRPMDYLDKEKRPVIVVDFKDVDLL